MAYYVRTLGQRKPSLENTVRHFHQKKFGYPISEVYSYLLLLLSYT